MFVDFRRIDRRTGAGGRGGPRVIVCRVMLNQEPGIPRTSGTPHGRARLVTGNHGRHDRHARIRRDVARYRLGRTQQARLSAFLFVSPSFSAIQS